MYAFPPLTAACLQRWAVLLSEYSYEVEFQRNDIDMLVQIVCQGFP